jgi:hypothetical protein
VLLGGGTRLFDGAAWSTIRLTKLGVVEAGARTGLRFRVEH